MFAGFRQTRLLANGVNIHTRIGGSGPPLLLLHGYPQSQLIWHRVAEELAKHYTVVLTDLRGYGQSDKPAGQPDHTNYSKRTMAQDQTQVMRQLGFDEFYLCGHDRGGRVSHRLAVDHPEAVKKLMLLDISPTLTMYEQTNMEFARSYWWWFWLIQPAPFPESMVAAAPETYLKKKIGWGHAGLSAFTEQTYSAYLSYVSDPATMHGMCEDYRAAASIDLAHDRADRDAGKKIACPVNVLWGEFGVVNRCFKPLEDWRVVADDVRGRTLPCGHYIPEEVPVLLLDEMKAFFV
ncbi:MAG: alpha/beta hydrolase [Betaproteobacteria bacterium]|nr:alpha/beta hydrolase [Betaproteobacteria bacterium]